METPDNSKHLIGKQKTDPIKQGPKMSHSKTVKGDLQSATKFNVASTYKFSLDLNKVKKTNQLLSEKLQKHQ